MGRRLRSPQGVFGPRRSLSSAFYLQDRRRLSPGCGGLTFREDPKTRWTLIVGNALRHCRVGHGMSCRINGKRALLTSRSFRTEKVIVECLLSTSSTTAIAWVGGFQNRESAQDTMDVDRRQRLEALPGWSWDPYSDQWEEGFSYLREYSNREGHCRAPVGCTTDDGFRLDGWVSNQRSAKETMNIDRRQRLEALPGWTWDPRSDQWEEGFAQLKNFAGREGHCRVPQGYKTDDGYRLGTWVRTQRSKKEKMGSNRRQRLEALPGWVWRIEK